MCKIGDGLRVSVSSDLFSFNGFWRILDPLVGEGFLVEHFFESVPFLRGFLIWHSQVEPPMEKDRSKGNGLCRLKIILCNTFEIYLPRFYIIDNVYVDIYFSTDNITNRSQLHLCPLVWVLHIWTKRWSMWPSSKVGEMIISTSSIKWLNLCKYIWVWDGLKTLITLVYGHRGVGNNNENNITIGNVRLHYLQMVLSMSFYSRIGRMSIVGWKDMWLHLDDQGILL